MVTQDGEEGVAHAQFGQPDLILLDVMMPGIGGFEACRRLKTNLATSEIPVIFTCRPTTRWSLYCLAKLGNMQDIMQRADHLVSLDERYRPFAEQLHGLAKAYQSKSILRLVERHMAERQA